MAQVGCGTPSEVRISGMERRAIHTHATPAKALAQLVDAALTVAPALPTETPPDRRRKFTVSRGRETLSRKPFEKKIQSGGQTLTHFDRYPMRLIFCQLITTNSIRIVIIEGNDRTDDFGGGL